MKKSLVKWLAIAAIALIPIIVIASSIVTTSNKEVDLRNQFTQKFSERTVFYNSMFQTIAGKSQVAVKNDSSFKANVDLIMKGRQDAPGIFMKWVTETNPNANFDQVSALYQDLSRAIEAKRAEFVVKETYLQDIKKEHDNLRTKWPSSWSLAIMGNSKEILYKPIVTDQTEETIKTGREAQTAVFTK